ncbi:hypothetical protein [Geothrix sp. 21YS21S-2]|uniref:hypothetical protein n=1 Tax=Geothrix sp. 21YS21S-2 TaxID=3068893 RepID=UPI0027BA6200|nr:hypothetical protein [Geothrix sp. 21YS21S-2]
MRMNRHLVIPIVTLAIGAALGGGAATIYWLDANTRSAELRLRVSTFERTRLLQHLRAQENPTAIAEHEILLDGDVAGLRFYVDHFKRKDPGSAEALLRAARYRAQHPTPSAASETAATFQPAPSQPLPR